MTRYTPSGQVTTIPQNQAEFEKIQTAINDTLSRKGDVPNGMEADLDMNNNRILNHPAPANPTDLVRAQDLDGLLPEGGNLIVVSNTENVVLTQAQTTVTFGDVSTLQTAYYVSGINVDQGRLSPTIDYTVTNSTTIELTSTFPTGTVITAVQNEGAEEVESDLQVFDNVATMKAAALNAGDTALCLRYYAGGALIQGLLFEIAATGTTDGYVNHALTNGNKALLLTDTTLSPKQAGCVGDNSTNDQDAMQAAWDYAYLNGLELKGGVGRYIVDRITFPPASVTEPRGDAFKATGIGGGNAFVTNPPELCTCLVSTTDSPVLEITNPLAFNNTGGAWDIRGWRFQGTSDNHPVVKMAQMGEYAFFKSNEVRQGGDGDGIGIDYALKGNLENCNILNSDAFATADGTTTRTGAGVRIKMPLGGGIFTMKKLTSRGFDTGYILGENGTSTNNMSGLLLEQCESSVVRVGIDIRQFTLAATLDTCYFEGIEEKHIVDAGTMTHVHSGIHFFNPESAGTGTTYIDSTAATYGNRYVANYLECNDNNDTLVDIDASFPKICKDNYLVYAGTTATNLTGINIQGANPKLEGDNTFLPRGDWLGTNTTKYRKNYTGRIVGEVEAQNGSDFSSKNLIGVMTFMPATTILTESDVSSNVLTFTEEANTYTMTPTVATSVNTISFDTSLIADNIRRVKIRTTNTNLTITNSAFVKLNGGTSFTGVGSITFDIEKIGSSWFAYEVARASYV